MNIATPITVMLVDDSAVIRNILKSMLKTESFINIVGEAENGQLGIDKASTLKPEIILLDIEMPVLDGISALPHILKASSRSSVIMVSTLTEKNASISIKAMGLGASDYLQKPDAKTNIDTFKTDLLNKIKSLAYARRDTLITGKNISEPSYKTRNIRNSIIPDAIAIASSTGGPQALQVVFDGLKTNLPNKPIFITQHMPPVFTKYLANSISNSTGLKCYEATDGMLVESGNIYIAPGDFHMLAKRDGVNLKIKLTQDPPENFCRPAADPMLRSLVDIYGDKLLVVVLTGMGQDGLLGAKAAVDKGSIVIAQDKASSVVWGMPGAVCEAGITSGIYSLDMIAPTIIDLCKGKNHFGG